MKEKSCDKGKKFLNPQNKKPHTINEEEDEE